MGVIDELSDGEAHNLKCSLQRLGDTSSLVDDLDGLYNTISQLVDVSGVPPRDEIVMGGMFLSVCRYCLSKACLEILRGHLTDSLALSRRAIELCAFAHRIATHPHLAKTWLEANDSNSAYDIYKKKFGGKAIFPKEEALLSKLGTRYGFCSKSVHSSIYSLSQRMEFETGEKKFRMLYNLFELKQDDQSEPARMFLWTLDTHFGIIKVFESVLRDAIEHDVKGWEVMRNGVDAKLALHKQKWARVILS